jgi:hypothetical protein
VDLYLSCKQKPGAKNVGAENKNFGCANERKPANNSKDLRL